MLVDIIQKCVVINATLNDLYGGTSSIMTSNRDISIQPYATSSILQHHYQAGASSLSASASNNAANNPNMGEYNKSLKSNSNLDNGPSSAHTGDGKQTEFDQGHDNGANGNDALSVLLQKQSSEATSQVS